MSRKANPAMIGVFVVGAVVLAVIAILLFGSQQFFTKSNKFILYFDESVNGLEAGAPVKFKGVEIGQVEDVLIHFDFNDGTAFIPVIIRIESHDLPMENGHGLSLEDNGIFQQQVANGLRASLVYQSYFTGKLFIELDYDPEKRKPQFVGVDSPYKEIPTVSSELEEVWSAASRMFAQISKIDFKQISDSIQSVMTKLDGGLEDLDFEHINDSFIGAMIALESLTSNADEHLEPVADDLQIALKKAGSAFDNVASAAATFDDSMSQGSILGNQWDDALVDISAAARSIRTFADYLERNPRALLTGKKLPSQ